MTSLISNVILQTLCDHQGSLEFGRLEEAIAQKFTVADTVLRGALFDDGRIAIRAGRERAGGGPAIGQDSLLVAKSDLRVCQKKPGLCPRCDSLHLCRYFVCGDCSFGDKCKNTHSLDLPYNAEILKRSGLHGWTEKQLFQLLLQNDPYLLPEICPHYNKGDGPHGSCKFAASCTKLHACLHHFQGDCKFGVKCKRLHHIDPQGMKIFRGFSQENIINLPHIYRNKFIIAGPRAGPAVPVPAPVRIPTQPSHQPPHRASHQASHQALHQAPRCKPGSPTSPAAPTGPTAASKPMSDADRNEICLFFIRRHCSFKDKCARVHWHLPYRWQVLDSDGVTWKDLPNMEDVEKAYCDPEHDTSGTNQPPPSSSIFSLFSFQSPASPVEQGVDFTAMKYGQSPVRRLSTASSVSKPPHFILTTQWLWHWKDDGGKWLEFGKGDGDAQASVTSETLENVYLADRDTEIPFGAGKHQYVLHFKGEQGTQRMYQENLRFKTKREVRRRPRFVSAHDVNAKLDSSASPHSSSSSTAESVPSHWDKNALPDFGYKLILLSESVKEYKMIEKLFRNTMPQRRINSIQRIQNPSLWRVFQWQREQMRERNGGNLVNEKYLFHGTDESLIEAICEQNFDWRMCGVHGTAYGKGSYFARDASYSDRYSIKKGLNKIMFVALVLVGEYSRGRSTYVRPPPKGNNKTFYDSCVDSEGNPSIYVVFEKQQIYPEYIIDYS